MKFFLGFLVGALFIIGVQLRFAPIPNLPEETSEPVDVTVPASARVERQESPTDSGAPPPGNNSAELSATRQNVNQDNLRLRQTEAKNNPERISLPDTHAGFVTKDGPSLPDEHARMEQEEVDEVWADQAQGLIADHVANHRFGQSVFVVSLRCRTTRCEIAGTVYGDNGGDSWESITDDMRTQPWFASYFDDSVYGAGGVFPGEFRFVTILARAGSATTTPVAP